MSIFSCVRNPVRGADVDASIIPPTPTLDITTLTASSGSSVTASVGTNAIAVPSTHSELMVYVGDLPVAREKVVLHVKIDSASPQAVDVFTCGCVCIKNVAGKTVAFGAQYLNRNSNTLTSSVLDLSVIPHKGKVQVAPSGVTGTVNLDRCIPSLYEPTRPILLLEDEYQTFQIASASRKRDIFIQEYDGDTNLTPVRHIHIPENQTVNVVCRFRYIFAFSIDTPTLTVTCPTNALLNTDPGIVWEPPFTASKTINVAAGDVADFRTAMNDGSDYVDVVLAPGTYDLQAGGVTTYRMNNTQYATAVTKNRRIRSSTGKASDVLFKVATPGNAGSQWDVTLSAGKSWILSDISFDIAGCILTSAATGILNFFGPVHMCRVTVTGAAAGSSDTSVKWLATSGTGSFTVYAAWCTFSGASKDLTAANGDGTKTYIPTLHQIGNYLDGNGSGGADQVITNHNKGIVAAWGCSFGNLTTGTRTRVASELEEAPDYLMYCRSYPENYITVIGVDATGSGTANPSFLHFCDFQAAGVFDAIKSVVCSTMKTYTTGRPMAYVASSITTPKWTGADIHGAQSGGSDILLDALSTALSVSGCRITHYSESQSQGLIRLLKTGASGSVGTLTNVLLRTKAVTTSTRSPWVNMADANEQAILKNVLALAPNASNGVTQTIAGTTSSATNCRVQIASKPGTWDTVFATANTGNTFSLTAPDLDSNDIPTLAGNLNGGGAAAVVGSGDIYGRPWLGGTGVQGCAEQTAVRSGAFLYPLVWI